VNVTFAAVNKQVRWNHSSTCRRCSAYDISMVSAPGNACTDATIIQRSEHLLGLVQYQL